MSADARTPEMIVVRPVTLGDVPGVRDCVGAVAEERRYLAVTKPFSLQETALYIARIVDAGHPYFVADDAGSIVGWCDVVPKMGQVHAHVGVLGIGVRHAWRGRGLGKRLIGTALKASRERFEQVELSVYEQNTNAQRLYRNVGFVERGRMPRGRKVDDVTDDVILMSVLFDSDR